MFRNVVVVMTGTCGDMTLRRTLNIHQDPEPPLRALNHAGAVPTLLMTNLCHTGYYRSSCTYPSRRSTKRKPDS